MDEKLECDKCDFKCRKERYMNAHKNKFHPDTNREISKEQYNFIKPFMKDNLDGIKIVNGVPKVVFVCWFSHKTFLPLMTENRFAALKSLIGNIGVPVIMITSENYMNFEIGKSPIHEAFNYLTGVHKADYLRGYLMNHYGGGYHDVKYRDLGWKDEWKKLKKSSVWIVGRRERKEQWIGYPPGQKHIQKEFNKLATMCWIICRPHTLYTKELLEKVNNTLDKHLDMLKKYPAEIPRGYYDDKPFDMAPPNSYPLRWLEILGEIFHPLMLKYNKHLVFDLPDAAPKRYK
jgi:hypothetical protein